MSMTIEGLEVERLPWQEGLDSMEVRQGDHLTGLGPTGVGKTTFETQVVSKWPYVVAIGTKPADDSLDKLINKGFKRIEHWPPNPSDNRVVLWPNVYKLNAQEVGNRISDCLEDVRKRGAWAIVMDEIADLINDIPVSKTTSKQKLGLRGWRFAPRTVEEPRPSLVASITRTYREGRAIGVSMVGFSQRPAFITRFPYSQATHLVLWDTNDLRDAKILGDISGKGNPREIMRILSTLDYHEFLYVDTRSGRMFISKVEEV